MLLDYQNRIAFLLNKVGEIKGRVEFQKIIFILQNEGIDFDKVYSYNVFGPYSEELQYEIDELIKSDLILEDKSKGDGLISFKLNNSREVAADTQFIGKEKLIEFLASLERNELELISTIYYFKNLDYTDKMVEKKIEILKPSLMKHFQSSFSKYQTIKNKSFA